MPSLFNRRSRSVSTSRPPPPPSSSAHVAAAQAFLANRPAQGNLSASAAAAALRSMSPTPTPIDQIQTKRMLNRQSSNASNASASRGRARTNLARRPSTGSMTDRTFRSPSPGRSTPVQSAETAHDAPPVPPLPTTFATEDVPPIPQRSHRRSMSLENFTTRVASPQPPARIPLPNQKGTVSNVAALAARRSTSLQQSAELERTDSRDSRNSFNFSYPRGTRPNSPPPSRSTVVSGAAIEEGSAPRVANGLSAAETAHIQRNLSKTAEKPVKKKKKIVQHAPGEGGHLQTGSMHVNSNTAAAAASATTAQSESTGASSRPARAAPKAALTGENSHFPEHSSSSDAEAESRAAEQAKEKRAQRAAGVLTKQPSVVREDWEGEQEETRASMDQPASVLSAQPARTIQSKKPSAEANVSRKMGDVVKHSANGMDTSHTLAPGDADSQTVRQSSISPSRSFRFSDRLASDLTAGRKHEPLRSISPAKSALKHHSPAPSESSPTDGNFPAGRGSSRTPSESSEISEVVSRKKANRVSFETSPEVASQAMDSEMPSRQKDGPKKSWLGFGKAKSSPLAVHTSEDPEEGMKPRPALPSFGSVRKNRGNDVSPSPAARVVDSPKGSTGSLSDGSSGVDIATAETSVSSDHAIGRVLFNEPHKKTSAPLPPEVTTVEGTGYVSDTDVLSSDDEMVDSPQALSTTAASEQSTTASGMIQQAANTSGSHHDLAVPAIAIQPATPGMDSSEPTDEWMSPVPGGFPETDDLEDITAVPTTPESNSVSRHSPQGLGLSQNDANFSPSSTTVEASASPLNTIAEESDNDSLYSDAAEDLSDMEGDGFGSINAIVESPMVASPVDPFPDSPQVPFPEDDQADSRAREAVSWDQSQAYWSGITQQLKQNADTSARPKGLADSKYAFTPTEVITPEVTKPISAATLAPPAEVSPKKLGKKKRQPPVTGFQQPVTSAPATPPAAIGRSMAAKTMRNQNAGKPTESPPSRLGGGQSTFRHSMREPDKLPSSLRPRPQSMVDSPAQSMPVPNRSRPTKQAAKPPPTPSALHKVISNDSDSDSSFKRSRTKKPAGSGFARRTMRGSSVSDDRAPASKAKGFGSPPPVPRSPLASPASPRMRMTMRGSSDMAVPTLRGQQESKRSSSLFSKSRKAKSPTRPMSGFGFKSKSRFADSDDEEDGPRTTTYRSRFEASSDEEDEPLRPVRGIPKRKDEGDSTDLEDSSDDQRRQPKTGTPRKALGQPLNSASPVVSESMSPATAKKKGLWGRLRGTKKEKEPNAAFTITERNKTTQLANGNTDHNEAESKDAAQLGFNSVAEKDKLVAETLRKLEASQLSPALPTSPSSPSSVTGKLQRRATPQRVLSDSWPLTPKIEDVGPERPVTSAGAPAATRPGMGERLPTSETVRTAGGTPVYGRSGKKKKFPRLRKAFGLTD